MKKLIVLLACFTLFTGCSESQEVLRLDSVEREEVESESELPVVFESVSSQDYNLKIPVLAGLKFENLGGDYEFILRSEDDAITFYFESDYSPGEPENPSINEWQVQGADGVDYSVTRISDGDGQGGLVYFIEDGKGFDFSVYLGSGGNLAEDEKLIERVIELLEVEKV